MWFNCVWTITHTHTPGGAEFLPSGIQSFCALSEDLAAKSC